MPSSKSAPQYGLITIGNALVDVLSKTDDEYIAQQKAEAGMEKGSMNLVDAKRALALYDWWISGKHNGLLCFLWRSWCLYW